jgi:hypothetical protein
MYANLVHIDRIHIYFLFGAFVQLVQFLKANPTYLISPILIDLLSEDHHFSNEVIFIIWLNKLSMAGVKFTL